MQYQVVLVAVFFVVLAIILSVALHTLAGALLLWAISLFVDFQWTWLQALGAGIILACLNGLVSKSRE